ncbi:hypothetical protein QA599_12400 [Haloarculaceae archaeon H-GB1-1]|nr:hypothetical protein [Haloarculaceae archaeon H-GB1-1]
MTPHDTDTFEDSDDDPTNGAASENGADEPDERASLVDEFASDTEPDDEWGNSEEDPETLSLTDPEPDTDPVVDLGLSETEVPPDVDAEEETVDANGEPGTLEQGIAADTSSENPLEPDNDTSSENPLEPDNDTSSENPLDSGSDDSSEGPLDSGSDDSSENPLESDTAERAESDDESTPDDRGEDGVVEALVDELEERDLSEREREVLATNLGLEPPNSVAARLSHLQEQVSAIIAYRDALEAFIDDKDAAAAILDDLQTQVNEVATDVADLEEQFDDLQQTVEALDDRHRAEFDDLERRMDGIGDAVDEATQPLESDLEALRDRVENGERWRETVRDALQPLTATDLDSETSESDTSE